MIFYGNKTVFFMLLLYFCFFLRSDPEEKLIGWSTSPRGAGVIFGGDIVQDFNHLNGLDFIIRAHQLVMEGWRSMFNDSLFTVWSAPNYCYRCGNMAAVLLLAGKTRKFIPFDAAPLQDRTAPCKLALPEYFL